ncbi:50S ribosomal protein L9 [Elusimicrobiota bacterium]
MQIILTKDVNKLGKVGEVKKVKAGYGRNYLIPRGLALKYCEGVRKTFEAQESNRQAKLDKELEKINKLKTNIEKLKVEFPVLVDVNENLYGSIGIGQILKNLKKQGIVLPKGAHVVLEEPLKKIGEFKVELQFRPGVSASLQIAVTKSTVSS